MNVQSSRWAVPEHSGCMRLMQMFFVLILHVYLLPLCVILTVSWCVYNVAGFSVIKSNPGSIVTYCAWIFTHSLMNFIVLAKCTGNVKFLFSRSDMRDVYVLYVQVV